MKKPSLIWTPPGIFAIGGSLCLGSGGERGDFGMSVTVSLGWCIVTLYLWPLSAARWQ